ncbi:sensor histidine kinase [Streptomyces sp. BI20]|uniref:sensor histidine kinase n=1 Tax=Streptomyces sp. BI20 TaxID=3403460 RepID=UPI003C7204F4
MNQWEEPAEEDSRVRRGWLVGAVAVCALVFALDVVAARPDAYRPMLIGEAVVIAGALLPVRGVSAPVRLGAVAALSLGVTALTAWQHRSYTWGVGESLALLFALGGAARSARPGRAALGACLALVTALLAALLRSLPVRDWSEMAFPLTLAAAFVGGLGWYLRVLDERRVRAVDAVRQRERLRLARDLHDDVAHHVTGMVVQAQAARTVPGLSAGARDELLRGIETAGDETLEAMRRLVRVLRSEPGGESDPVVRPGALAAELGAMVARFAGARTGSAELRISARARAALPAGPEVESTACRVVREALTNVDRHAGPGSLVGVEVDVVPGVEGELLRVSVVNGAAGVGVARRSGGLGLVGLAERVRGIEGSLAAGPEAGGGWRVTADLPLGGSGPR